MKGHPGMGPRRGKRNHSNGRSYGFTLIELLVALSVLGLIAFLSFDGLRFAMRAWGGAVERSTGLHEVTTAQRFLRSRLESLYVFDVEGGPARPVYPVEGDATSLTFSAPLASAAHAAGLHRFTLERRASAPGEFDLDVAWYSDRNGRPNRIAATPARETLLAGITAFDIAYLVNDPGSPRWVSSWRERADAPKLLRIRVQFPAGDARTWPDLVMAPRVTTDANCAFDVVSQQCR